MRSDYFGVRIVMNTLFVYLQCVHMYALPACMQISSLRADLSKRNRDQVETEWKQLLTSQNPDTLLDLRAIFDLQDEDRSGILEAAEVWIGVG